MIALDTNVIIRFLVRDDPRQANAVYSRFKQAESMHESLFVSLLVVLESIWVLESAYEKTRVEILDAFEALKDMSVLEFEKIQVVNALISEGRKSSVDLSDLLIALAAKSCGCSGGLTFDRKASKLQFFRLLA